MEDTLKCEFFGNFCTSMTLTLDRVIQHTSVYCSCIYMPNFIKIDKFFLDGRMDQCTYRQTIYQLY